MSKKLLLMLAVLIIVLSQAVRAQVSEIVGGLRATMIEFQRLISQETR